MGNADSLAHTHTQKPLSLEPCLSVTVESGLSPSRSACDALPLCGLSGVETCGYSPTSSLSSSLPLSSLTLLPSLSHSRLSLSFTVSFSLPRSMLRPSEETPTGMSDQSQSPSQAKHSTGSDPQPHTHTHTQPHTHTQTHTRDRCQLCACVCVCPSPHSLQQPWLYDLQ